MITTQHHPTHQGWCQCEALWRLCTHYWSTHRGGGHPKRHPFWGSWNRTKPSKPTQEFCKDDGDKFGWCCFSDFAGFFKMVERCNILPECTVVFFLFFFVCVWGGGMSSWRRSWARIALESQVCHCLPNLGRHFWCFNFLQKYPKIATIMVECHWNRSLIFFVNKSRCSVAMFHHHIISTWSHCSVALPFTNMISQQNLAQFLRNSGKHTFFLFIHLYILTTPLS